MADETRNSALQEEIAKIETAVTERFADSKRLTHILGSAQTATALAIIYGVDPDKATIAGLLHDWDKKYSSEELIERARVFGVKEDLEDPAVLPVLHSFTGAVAVSREFPELDMEIISAISKHTVASRCMSDLESIIYIADMIEPSRRYHGVEDLREAVGTVSLPVLMKLAYSHTLLYLIREGLTLYPDSARIYNALLSEGIG